MAAFPIDYQINVERRHGDDSYERAWGTDNMLIIPRNRHIPVLPLPQGDPIGPLLTSPRLLKMHRRRTDVPALTLPLDVFYSSAPSAHRASISVKVTNQGQHPPIL